MRLVYMGTPDFAVPGLVALAEAGHKIEAVVTGEDKAAGRGKKIIKTPVKEAAEALGLPVWQPEKVRDPAFIERLRAISPDAIIVTAYGHIIPDEILKLPKYGCINVHASLLPKYRGAAPIQWAILDGEEKSGVTIMQMDAGLDTGDMLGVAEVPIGALETGGSLFDKLAEAGASLLLEVLKQIEAGAVNRVAQPSESPTPYARMITKQDGLIDWSTPAVKIERQIRALSPWPSAYTTIGEKDLKIWRAEICEGEAGALPGTVIRVEKEAFVVQTGRDALRILEVQTAGKKRMDSGAFLRGFALNAGDRLI